MRTSAPGNSVHRAGPPGRANRVTRVIRVNRARPAVARPRRRASGFTLIEMLVVIAIVAMAAGVVALALRDSGADRLERDAARLVALLEGARAESRATGMAVWWVPAVADGRGGFRFVGLPDAADMPRQWLDAGVQAEVLGPPQVQLGPEAIIGPQRILLRLGTHRLELGTDGLAPFTILPATDPA